MISVVLVAMANYFPYQNAEFFNCAADECYETLDACPGGGQVHITAMENWRLTCESPQFIHCVKTECSKDVHPLIRAVVNRENAIGTLHGLYNLGTNAFIIVTTIVLTGITIITALSFALAIVKLGKWLAREFF